MLAPLILHVLYCLFYVPLLRREHCEHISRKTRKSTKIVNLQDRAAVSPETPPQEQGNVEATGLDG